MIPPAGSRIWWGNTRGGSSPPSGTISFLLLEIKELAILFP